MFTLVCAYRFKSCSHWYTQHVIEADDDVQFAVVTAVQFRFRNTIVAVGCVGTLHHNLDQKT